LPTAYHRGSHPIFRRVSSCGPCSLPH
jgi:hypothetical protein